MRIRLRWMIWIISDNFWIDFVQLQSLIDPPQREAFPNRSNTCNLSWKWNWLVWNSTIECSILFSCGTFIDYLVAEQNVQTTFFNDIARPLSWHCIKSGSKWFHRGFHTTFFEGLLMKKRVNLSVDGATSIANIKLCDRWNH